jgi:hypothetical protein
MADENEFFYLSSTREIHISRQVLDAAGRGKRGVLCDGRNVWSIRPSEHDLVHLPICMVCQTMFDDLEDSEGGVQGG